MEHVLSLQSFVHALHSRVARADDEHHDASGEKDWGEVHVSLPAEAAQDFVGKSSHVLRSAMRQAGAIITLEPPSSENSSTVLIIEGTRAAIMRSPRYLKKWSHACQQQVVRQLAVHPEAAPESDVSGAVPSERGSGQKVGGAQDRRHEAIICTKADAAGNALGAVINLAHATAMPVLCVLLPLPIPFPPTMAFSRVQSLLFLRNHADSSNVSFDLRAPVTLTLQIRTHVLETLVMPVFSAY